MSFFVPHLKKQKMRKEEFEKQSKLNQSYQVS